MPGDCSVGWIPNLNWGTFCEHLAFFHFPWLSICRVHLLPSIAHAFIHNNSLAFPE